MQNQDEVKIKKEEAETLKGELCKLLPGGLSTFFRPPHYSVLVWGLVFLVLFAIN